MAITKIEYYEGANLLGARTSAPFDQFTWVAVPEGSYTLTAKVFDDGVERATSAPVNFSAIISAYESETTAYIGRVEADGGVVIDKDYVDRVVAKAKELGILGNLVHWTSHLAGMKKDVGGAISKMYSFTGKDVTQPTGASQPIWTATDITYDGDNDFLDFGTILSTDPLALTGGGTIEARIKPNFTSPDIYMRLLDKSTGGSAAGGYAVYINSNTMGISVGGVDTGVQFSSTLSTSAYTDVAFLLTGTQALSYINGVYYTSASLGYPPAVTSNMRIGTWNHSTEREYKGSMPYVRIWDILLTESQINQMEAVI